LLPIAAADILAFAFSDCLELSREPAVNKRLYSGFNKSRYYCSLGITSDEAQYSRISKVKLA
jgi:hypothetical protein